MLLKTNQKYNTMSSKFKSDELIGFLDSFNYIVFCIL